MLSEILELLPDLGIASPSGKLRADVVSESDPPPVQALGQCSRHRGLAAADLAREACDCSGGHHNESWL